MKRISKTPGLFLCLFFCLVLVACNFQVPEPTPTSLPPTETSQPTPAPSETPTIIPTPTLGPGSTRLSEKDGILLYYVPEGSFEMGSEGYTDEEVPVHSVFLNAFWIDQTEVTNSQYALFLNEMGNQEEGNLLWLDENDGDSRIHKLDGFYQADTGLENHPVVEVTWFGASAYCTWAGGRLPTEAEWEKAAGGGQGLIYPWGAEIDCEHAQYKGCEPGGTREVGSLPASVSPFGALDMAGNVREYTADWYNPDYYKVSAVENPLGPEFSSTRVTRGGTFQDEATDLRLSKRTSANPGGSDPAIGFRCVMDAVPIE